MTYVLLGACALILVVSLISPRTITRTVVGVGKVARGLARDPRIPKRYRAAFLLGLAPWLGPIDELVLAVVSGIVWMRYREVVREHWNQRLKGA